MKKILFLLSFLFCGMSAFADAYDENGNLMDPPGEDRTFELYAWVRGDYDYGRKYYETHVRFDGTDVYFKDICPTANTGSWVKGSFIDENTIRILPQKYFTEMTDVGPYTTHLVMWHGKKVGYDQAGTQYDHYDLIVGEDANGNMTLTYADVDDWVSVADVPMQGIYDFASELRYTAIKNDYSTDIITEQPAGQRQRYSFMANIYSNDDNDFWADFGYKADIVWGEDGNVYFSTLTPDNPEATGWIKGEYDKDSRIITVPPFQCVGYMEDYNIYTYLANYDWDNQTTLDTPLSFQVDERGWIFATDEAEEQYPATIYRQGSITKGLTAINQYLTMMPIAEEPVEAPEDVQLKNYSIRYSEIWNEGEQTRLITVGIQNNDVYVKGLSDEIPEAWIHGTVSGDKVNFPSRQLIVDNNGNRYLYFQGGKFDWVEEYPCGVDEGITMNYIASTGEISSVAAENYKDADYIIAVYAGEVFTNIQSLQIYNVAMTPVGGEDGIKNLEPGTWNLKPETRNIYNLQGQRLSTLQRGINIVGGKKVLVK